MPSPFSLISSYPPPEIRGLVEGKNPQKIHVYVDLKNVMTSLFVPDVVKEIVANSKKIRNADSTIFQSVISFAGWWKKYFHYLNVPIKVFFCTDIGRSVYHLNIDKEYKASREIYLFNTLVHSREIKEIRDRNFKLAEKVVNKIKDVYFLCLPYLESDFLPYHLITRKFSDPNTTHIVCSNDKDLYQTLVNDNVIVVYKKKGCKDLLDKKTALTNYFKLDDCPIKGKTKRSLMIENLDFDYLPACMALCGDDGDEVKGVNGIGCVKALEIFNEKDLISRLVGSIDELNNRISSGGKFFLEDQLGLSSLPNKIWKKAFINNDIVTNAYKLISFEMLSRWFETPDTTEKIQKVRYVDKLLNKEGLDIIPNIQTFKTISKYIDDYQLDDEIVSYLF